MRQRSLHDRCQTPTLSHNPLVKTNADSARPPTNGRPNSSVSCARTVFPLVAALMPLSASLRAAELANLEPLISISVNDSRSAEIYRGMPLLVTVVLLHPLVSDSAASPILLASEPGPWTNAVNLTVSSANGDSQSWPFHSTVNPSNTIVLDSSHYAQLGWWLAPEQTLLLSTGQYTAEVTLNTTNVTLPDGWKGVVESVPANVQILDEPASLSEAQAENKYIQLTQYQLFLGRGSDALDQVNRLLANYPTNISGLRHKSMVLDAMGRIVEAYSACQAAVAEAFARNPSAMEPQQNLLLLQRQLLSKLFAPIIIRSITLQAQSLSLVWDSHPGEKYSVETSTDLKTWLTLESDLVAESELTRWTTAAGTEIRFFRIRR